MDNHLCIGWFDRFSVDGTPIREFKNHESSGVLFPKNQPMRLYSSLWNADDWATRGGLVKTDWSKAPFTASYRNFNADVCVWSGGVSSCSSGGNVGGRGWLSENLDITRQQRMKWVQRNYMIYNYCTDAKRFPQGYPPECAIAPWIWSCPHILHLPFFPLLCLPYKIWMDRSSFNQLIKLN